MGIHAKVDGLIARGKVSWRRRGGMQNLLMDYRNLLPAGTEDEVVEAVRETIEKAAPGGGYIISSSNSIHPGCKPENYIAMVKAVHKHGIYDA